MFHLWFEWSECCKNIFYWALSAVGHQCWWIEYLSQSVWNIIPIYNDSSPLIFRVYAKVCLFWAILYKLWLRAFLSCMSIVYSWLNCFHESNMSNRAPPVHLHLKRVLALAGPGHFLVFCNFNRSADTIMHQSRHKTEVAINLFNHKGRGWYFD